MAHVDDLTLVNSAQMAAADNIYLAKLGDADPDRRAQLSELAEYLGGSSDLIAALKTALPITQGTFTPQLEATGGNPTVTYGARSGRYLRVDNLIVFDLHVLTTARTGGSGSLRIGNLPFTFPTTIPFVCRPNTITYTGQLIGRGVSGDSKLSLDAVGSASGPSPLAITAWPANAAIQVSGAFALAAP